MYNPSLRKESRYEPAAVIPLKKHTSILDWLEETGRLIPREIEETIDLLQDDVEISELMDVDDHAYEEDDDEVGLDED